MSSNRDLCWNLVCSDLNFAKGKKMWEHGAKFVELPTLPLVVLIVMASGTITSGAGTRRIKVELSFI